MQHFLSMALPRCLLPQRLRCRSILPTTARVIQRDGLKSMAANHIPVVECYVIFVVSQQCGKLDKCHSATPACLFCYQASYYSSCFDALQQTPKLLTLSSFDSRSLAISSSDGRPPAVTSDARVKVQYDSLLLVGGAMVVCCLLFLSVSALPHNNNNNKHFYCRAATHTSIKGG